ncbi:hypothetical protein SEVIR_2G319700v4 [Setaria viridis]|uniref:Uncharacterized protein n=2 Tax=Setaria TaxID=4554 RepID=K3ZV00_SETIT|nr:tetratricopeptide repeat domain-containing protein PYG7, chloroplastic [Setaria italica]XP_034578435.1 tetratricopeptide repeat domain-containing protein PYG7, chloroplastic [Setaria viridis]RCV12958.1 hypothetical protein SETIT_2G308700v2 [Setaria italica]TKW34655.1 hypothetical protein SEVIR_2G319700v2 [Setaria viridis]
MARLLLFPSQAWVDPGRLLLRPAAPSSVAKPSAHCHHGGRVFIARAAERASVTTPAGARRLGVLPAVRRRPLPSLCWKEGASLGISPTRGVILASEIEEAFCLSSDKDNRSSRNLLLQFGALPCCTMVWLSTAQSAQSSVGTKLNMVYEVGELFELGIQLSYLLILLGLLGAGTFFVIRQVLVRRELDLSAKELQEQVRSGDASATEYFELGAVMLRRKFYPAAIKYLQQAIDKWDRDEQDLAQVYNALGVSYKRDNKLDMAIKQFEKAVELQPGYVTAWNNLGDAYELKKDLKSALKAFEEVLLFDPNNKVARPRVDDLRQRANMYKGVPIKSEKR